MSEATAELRARNADIEDMYRRVFDLREALGRAEQMAAIGQTAANVAHQIGTPLNLISGYVQMLLADAPHDARTRRRLEMVQRQIGQVTRACAACSIARAGSRRARRSSRHALIERVLEIAQPRLDRGTDRRDGRGAAPRCRGIEADAVQLELALLNLVTNAIDAMPDGGAPGVSLVSAGTGSVSRWPIPAPASPTPCCRASSSPGLRPNLPAGVPAWAWPSPAT